MINSRVRADLIMLFVAIVWGSTFVAQRLGMNGVGPYFYSGIRFLMGGLLLLPLIAWQNKGRPLQLSNHFWRDGFVLGCVICFAINFQQVGLQFTSIANAGFITGLYVVLVPAASIFLKHPVYWGTWIGVFLAALGLYFLSVQPNFTISWGDSLQLFGAVAWTVHVLLVGVLAKKHDPYALSAMQFIVCGVISLMLSSQLEVITTAGIQHALGAILYGGLFSVGVGFTLQTVAQRDAVASHAAVILSMESVFAALFGWWLLGEALSARSLIGCTLMLCGMLCSQLLPFYFKKESPVSAHVQ